MGEPELKACPFCGGKPEIYIPKMHNYRVYWYDVRIQCSQCGAMSKTFRQDGTPFPSGCDGATFDAIEAWNNRTASKRITRSCR